MGIMLDEVLGGLLERVKGARCVVLAGADGVVVAATVAPGGPAPDAVGATLADLFRRLGAGCRDAGLAAPSEFTSSSGQEHAILRVVTGQYLLIAVLDGASSAGLARFELRKAAA